ncbi:ankyrin-2 isoform X2 [Notolabrus celidotus]|uniref:ankyrin-2 isoform X2 n=1 Tax=Notolabrus celidotus TaxID=1203425 RepID=UPI0014907148|nr:ankyrin-2 isoform X2 [Notolabrus celidotus]
MGTQGTGRKRSTKKERSTAEDDALNLIAREAEARLAAKRAARAEAREIRMKELERQQKELSDEDERMSVGSRGSVRTEDRDYLEKGSRAASALTSTTLTSLGGTSSRRGSGETAITVDAETSIREIKEIHELKDQIQDVETKFTQNLKEAKDTLAEVEEKYRKAMVSNAQLDNEKNNLMYQVDTLKDSLMELEELLSESRRDYEEKVKEYEREKHAHSVLQFQFNEMKETLKQSEELLNKHGIVLGPDLNINGDASETQEGGSPGEDPSSPSTQEPQTTPTEGNSMLGKTKETQLRSGRKEKVDLDPTGSETICNVAAEQKTSLAAQGGGSFSQKQSADVTDSSVMKVIDTIVRSSSLEKIVEETETTEEGESGETRNQDLEEREKTLEEQREESKTDSDPQQNVTQQSLANVSQEAQQESGNTKKAETEKEEESKPQGATSSGKKRKKKKKGKKKAATNEDDGQPKDVTQKEKGKTEKGPQSAALDGNINPRFCCWPVTETLKELKGNQVKNKQDKQKGKEVGGVDVAKADKPENPYDLVKESQTDDKEQTENLTEVEALEPAGTAEAPQEVRDDDTTDQKNKQQSLEKAEEATVTTETFFQVDTPKKSETDPKKDQQNKEEVRSTTSPPPECNLCTPVTMNNSRDAEITEGAATSQIDDVTENSKEQTTEKESREEEIAACASPNEIRANHVTDVKKEDQSLDVMTLSESFSCADNLQESKTNSVNEQDKDQSLETIEEESTTNPGSEINFGASDFEDSLDAESTGYPANRCTSSEYNSDIDNSTNSSIIQSELLDSTESEAGSINELKSECTVNNPQYPFETIYEETTETELFVPSGADAVLDESTNSLESSLVYSSSTDALSDCQQSLSGSEQPSEMISEPVDVDSGSEHTPIELSERGSEEETETVIDLAESRTEMLSEPGNLDSRSVDTPIEVSERVSEEEAEKDKDPEEQRAELLSEPVDVDSGRDLTAVKVSERVSEEEAEKDKDEESKAELLSEPADMDSGSDHTPTESSERGLEEEADIVKDSEEAGAEQLSQPADMDSSGDNTPIKVSDKGSEEEIATVKDNKDPEAETAQESSPPPLDADQSELIPDRAAQEELNGDLREPEGLVEPDSSLHDKLIDASDAEKSPLEVLVQTSDLELIQTSQFEDLTDESRAELSQETDDINMIEVLDAPDSPKEGAEFSSSLNQDQSIAEDDPEQTNSQSETHIFPLIDCRHEPLKDKSDDYQRSEGSSQPALLDSDEDNSVDEEGQSFDFDDLDIDDAITMNLTEDPKQISIVEGVEVVSMEGSKGSLELTQSNAESIENTLNKLVESNDKCTSHQVDPLHPDSDAVSQDTLNSWAQTLGDTSSENLVEDQAKILEEVGVTEEARPSSEEGKRLKVGELSFVKQKSSQATSLPLEEGLDALNDEDSVSLKSWDVVSSNSELQTGKSSKKGSKKGKGKNKEDCKMS